MPKEHSGVSQLPQLGLRKRFINTFKRSVFVYKYEKKQKPQRKSPDGAGQRGRVQKRMNRGAGPALVASVFRLARRTSKSFRGTLGSIFRAAP